MKYREKLVHRLNWPRLMTVVMIVNDRNMQKIRATPAKLTYS